MIEAKSLRIGNWLDMERCDDSVGRFPYPVIKARTEITTDHIFAISKGAKHYHPIPLTPEVLSKTNICQAFTTDPQQPHYSEKFFIGNCAIHHYTEARGRYMFYGDEDLRFEVKYLHQLQNLIFITTGEELTVNL